MNVNSGTTWDEEVFAFWSPDHELTTDSVATAARVQAMRATNGPCEVVGQPQLQ